MANLRQCLTAAAFALVRSQELKVDIDGQGRFTVNLDDELWLTGGEVHIAQESSGKGGLVVQGTQEKSTGQDEFGQYQSVTLNWASSQEQRVLMRASFRSYPADPGLVVFEQYFPEDLHLTAKSPVGKTDVAPQTLFPSFHSGAAPNLDCFAYHGVFPKMKQCTLTSYNASHQGGAPLVLYKSNSHGGLAPMTVFSPLSHPKAQQMFSGDVGLVGAGVKGTVNVIPAGWRQLFMLSSGRGITDGMMAWGDRMLRYTGKRRADMYRDDSIRSIGFWTDNGGYYHYNTGSNETYEEVLPKVKAYHDSIGVPFGHWQFDSWFYPKDGPVDAGGGGGAVTNWTALPSVFPHGMQYIQSKLKLPIVMHNRQWSPKSDYVKHEAFSWYKSPTAAVPENPEAFFRSFFTQQEGWGLAMYEQDWMCTEYDRVEALRTNISLADEWLRGMAVGAESSNRTVQYCMPYPYDILSASAYPAVTNARASDDYILRDTQWAIGGTSMFYWALGILPFKDGFYSSNLPQLGGATVGPETHPDRAALMSALSCAMVGPMDGIHLLNATRVMSTCRSDGILLKPDRPLMPLESCFASGTDSASCFNYFTYSEYPGWGRISYIFMNSPSDLTLSDVPGVTVEEYALYNWYTSSLAFLNASATSPIEPGYEGHAYVVLSPVRNGWALLGDPAKFVSASTLRIVEVSGSAGTLTVAVRLVEGEKVKICAAERSTSTVQCQVATSAKSDVVSLTFGKADAEMEILV